MSLKKSKKRLVKIKYDYDIMPPEELGNFLIVAASIIGIVLSIVELCLNHGDSRDRYFFIIVLIGAIAVLAYALPTALKSFLGRQKSKKNRKEAVKHGKKVIGEIVSFEEIKINNHNDKNFSYTVEYEDPLEGKTTTIITPYTIRNSMYVREEDLPIKVTIYIHKNVAIVDNLINPPMAKMFYRKYLNTFIGMLALITMMSCIIYSYYNPTMAAMIMIIVPILAIITINHKK